ncbi:MAG: Na+/H+ antiporter subunit E [Tabrizicola sp.]|uniref:Na+/H+ antiporter subunit E n=1 Tax=Tabrizicola sp. TaxID=2005166 RepID=UPI002736A86D|nr:Na+/H+ antiporter subunit E [Tabrizicola sp.]MDP3263552.1 Na+/H+ antiporter subunit E [Tabrizicola sp.]MDP3649743.1 Na+/H+ antiporter subunit E [Paracoccaceae bacterium]MDZ4070036.1 Na+/H+ antiporter subunit E [Tabrizicola sp.]
MLRKLLPHPYLSLTLFVVWMLLVNQFKIGSLVMAAILALIIPHLTAAWWPDRPPIRRPLSLFAYALLVLWDVIVANFQVARIVLFMPNARIRSAWITVPLDLKTPEAITLLAGTITMTPGTLTADMSSCGRALLIHALHAPDPDAVRDDIKSRYEARLKRIFE